MDAKTLSTRGREFTGTVRSDKMNKTVTVEWERRKFIPKFERYQRRRTIVKAHNPATINAEKGDLVLIKETRPISKTKSFIVIKIIKKHSAKLVEATEKKTVSEKKTSKKKTAEAQ